MGNSAQTLRRTNDRGAFEVLSRGEAERLPRDPSPRFRFQVPAHWRAPSGINPHAGEAQQRVLAWLATLGCGAGEISWAAAFDIPGYVGLPFPALSRDETFRLARFLALWLLWDDVHVERLENRWKLDAERVSSGRRPPGMTRFDEGWWQLLQEFARTRSAPWIASLCREMAAWSDAAAEEARAFQRYEDTGETPGFEAQLALRRATIGMTATVVLLEGTYGAAMPPDFSAHPVVRRLVHLSNELVALGNELLGLGKDLAGGQLNLVTTLMAEHGLPLEDAFEALVRRHDVAIAEYDALALSIGLGEFQGEPLVQRWLRDVRYASLGFTLWEAQAPRYAAHKVVVRGRVIEPAFDFRGAGEAQDFSARRWAPAESAARLPLPSRGAG